MIADQENVLDQHRYQGSMDPDRTHATLAQGSFDHNSNTNTNHHQGSGNIVNNSQIINNIMSAAALRGPALWFVICSTTGLGAVIAVTIGVILHVLRNGVDYGAALTIPNDMVNVQLEVPLFNAPNPDFALPPGPMVFHGRDEIIDDSFRLLMRPEGARLAYVGAGGIGKTSVALALLHDPRVKQRFNERLFQSCEALIDVDDLLEKLAEQCGVPPNTPRLRAAVAAQLSEGPPVILVLDNIETIWFVGGDDASVPAFEELLGMLAQIPSLSLVITSRGNVLPPSVRWSNAESAILEPFSLEAALKTFEDRAGQTVIESDVETATELLNLVDRMPLAVTLLGHLVRLRNPVSKLIDRWHREHSALLRTNSGHRTSNVEVSIELSISYLRSDEGWDEALQLLSLCSMLPKGLRPFVFEQLRPGFKNIDRARDTLLTYALISIGNGEVMTILSPIRHHILDQYPANPMHRDALHAIYLDIVKVIPAVIDESHQEFFQTVAPDMENLISMLLALISQPSLPVAQAGILFTLVRLNQWPTTSFTLALCHYLVDSRESEAFCMHASGLHQLALDEYRLAARHLETAAQLYYEFKHPLSAAGCRQYAGRAHQFLGEYDSAEALFTEALTVYAALNRDDGVAQCKSNIGNLMRMKGEYLAAIEQLQAARQTFISVGDTFGIAESSQGIGLAYLGQDDLESGATELEASYASFLTLDSPIHLARNTRYLAGLRRRQGDLVRAELLLTQAETFTIEIGVRSNHAHSKVEFGYLRRDQGRLEEAVTYFESAHDGFQVLGMQKDAAHCAEQLDILRSAGQH